MKPMNRREVMALGAATVAAAALPAGSPVAAAGTPGCSAPIPPAWAVGPPDGDFNWISAVGSEHEAKLEWLNSWRGRESMKCLRGGELKEGCECDNCEDYSRLEVTRQEGWDGKAEIKPGDWLRGGMGCMCSRCSYETFEEANGHAVGDEAVCEECMTLADWDIVDPERAAELRAEAEE